MSLLVPESLSRYACHSTDYCVRVGGDLAFPIEGEHSSSDWSWPRGQTSPPAKRSTRGRRDFGSATSVYQEAHWVCIISNEAIIIEVYQCSSSQKARVFVSIANEENAQRRIVKHATPYYFVDRDKDHSPGRSDSFATSFRYFFLRICQRCQQYS